MLRVASLLFSLQWSVEQTDRLETDRLQMNVQLMIQTQHYYLKSEV